MGCNKMTYKRVDNYELHMKTHTCHADCQNPICVAVRKAVADEREACAKIVDEMAGKDRLSNYFQVAAIAIRERGQNGL